MQELKGLNMIQYKHFNDRKSWLKGREKYPGIGASEAPAIVGASGWMTSTELWEIKTGRKTPKDISDNEFVKYGTEAEEHIRGLLLTDHMTLFIRKNARGLDAHLTESLNLSQGKMEFLK